MTQLSKQRPRTPREAASCAGPIDDLLDAELFKGLSDANAPAAFGLFGEMRAGMHRQRVGRLLLGRSLRRFPAPGAAEALRHRRQGKTGTRGVLHRGATPTSFESCGRWRTPWRATSRDEGNPAATERAMRGDKGPLRVLFLCTGNSCRSQMAEGWAKHLKAGAIEAYSAGVEPYPLNPLAIKVMAEAGVDISPCATNTSTNYGIFPSTTSSPSVITRTKRARFFPAKHGEFTSALMIRRGCGGCIRGASPRPLPPGAQTKFEDSSKRSRKV